MSRGLSFIAYRILSDPNPSHRADPSDAAAWAPMPNRLRCGAGIVVLAVLSALALSAPSINADAGPPRSVFLKLPAGQPAPEVGLEAYRHPSGHWHLRIAAQGFQFTSICVAQAAALPVGHAHVIRDGVKVASAYHPIVDLGSLPPGQHRIRVILRGQDHRALVGPDGLVQAEIDLVVPDA